MLFLQFVPLCPGARHLLMGRAPVLSVLLMLRLTNLGLLVAVAQAQTALHGYMGDTGGHCYCSIASQMQAIHSYTLQTSPNYPKHLQTTY